MKGPERDAAQRFVFAKVFLGSRKRLAGRPDRPRNGIASTQPIEDNNKKKRKMADSVVREFMRWYGRATRKGPGFRCRNHMSRARAFPISIFFYFQPSRLRSSRDNARNGDKRWMRMWASLYAAVGPLRYFRQWRDGPAKLSEACHRGPSCNIFEDLCLFSFFF